MPAPLTRRLFVGLVLGDETAGRLRRRLAPLLDEEGVRTSPAEDLHLTLAFLGAFSEPQRPRLEGALREELRGLVAPELVLSGTGAFPGRDAPRVLWSGVEERPGAPGRLAALRNRVLQAGLSLGWRPPAGDRARPFQPHVTVGRVREGPVNRAFFAADFDQGWLPVEVALVESRAGDGGARYRTLSAVPLVVRPG